MVRDMLKTKTDPTQNWGGFNFPTFHISDNFICRKYETDCFIFPTLQISDVSYLRQFLKIFLIQIFTFIQEDNNQIHMIYSSHKNKGTE